MSYIYFYYRTLWVSEHSDRDTHTHTYMCALCVVGKHGLLVYGMVRCWWWPISVNRVLCLPLAVSLTLSVPLCVQFFLCLALAGADWLMTSFCFCLSLCVIVSLCNLLILWVFICLIHYLGLWLWLWFVFVAVYFVLSVADCPFLCLTLSGYVVCICHIWLKPYFLSAFM